MSNETKTSLTIAALGIALSIAGGYGTVAFASGGIVERVNQAEAKVREIREDLNDIRLAVNRVDDRTREADKALARIEGSLSRK